MNGLDKPVTQPGFRPDLVKNPSPLASLPNKGDVPNKLGRSDSDEIIRELKLGFFEKLRFKLMSLEEREAYLIEKVNKEKERRKKKALLNDGK